MLGDPGQAVQKQAERLQNCFKMPSAPDTLPPLPIISLFSLGLYNDVEEWMFLICRSRVGTKEPITVILPPLTELNCTLKTEGNIFLYSFYNYCIISAGFCFCLGASEGQIPNQSTNIWGGNSEKTIISINPSHSPVLTHNDFFFKSRLDF